jgi:phospholipase/carboxylesterase
MKKIEFETYDSGNSHKRAIVGIHGWKGNRFSFKQIAISLRIPDTEWFFPEAPYDVDNDDSKKSWSYEIEPGIWERTEPKILLDDFLSSHVLSKYNSKNVFFVGFSQGGLMCFEYVLHTPYPWGGVFPIAGFITDPTNKDKLRFHPNQIETPILIGHGTEDDVVKLESSQLAYSHLKRKGAQVELLTYTGNHKIGIKFLRRMKEMITSVPMSD